MTGESPHAIYPQYCFHLSPTIEKWCRFRARQIHNLTIPRGFEGQDLYFHLNHPIKWVQLTGVVVAIDEFYGRRIYTVDDSSGTTIECVLSVPKQNANLAAITATAAEGSARTATPKGDKPTSAVAHATTAQDDVKPVVDGEIDVGDILLVKGNITVFRDQKQIRVHKIIHLRSTEDEVQFWKKMTEFHDTILSVPWSLSEKEVKRCRREAVGSREEDPRKHKHKRLKRRASEADDGASKSRARLITPVPGEDSSSKSKVTGLERGTKVAEPVAAGLSRKPKTRFASSGPDEGGLGKPQMTGLEGKTKRAGTTEPSTSKTMMITSTVNGGTTSRTRITGLEKDNTTRLEAAGSKLSRRPATDLSPVALGRRCPTHATATGLKNSTKRVESTDTESTTESTSNSEREIVPAVSRRRTSTKAKASGLERRPKRVNTVHVEGKYSALGI